eukprot:16452383-Heterocapsa_arctica.AAC.2
MERLRLLSLREAGPALRCCHILRRMRNAPYVMHTRPLATTQPRANLRGRNGFAAGRAGRRASPHRSRDVPSHGRYSIDPTACRYRRHITSTLLGHSLPPEGPSAEGPPSTKSERGGAECPKLN